MKPSQHVVLGETPPVMGKHTQKSEMFHVEHLQTALAPIVVQLSALHEAQLEHHELMRGLIGTLDMHLGKLVEIDDGIQDEMRMQTVGLKDAAKENAAYMNWQFARGKAYDEVASELRDQDQDDPKPVPQSIFVEAVSPPQRRDPLLLAFCAVQTAALAVLIWMLLSGYTVR